MLLAQLISDDFGSTVPRRFIPSDLGEYVSCSVDLSCVWSSCSTTVYYIGCFLVDVFHALMLVNISVPVDILHVLLVNKSE